jgi:hypothetical protein
MYSPPPGTIGHVACALPWPLSMLDTAVLNGRTACKAVQCCDEKIAGDRGLCRANVPSKASNSLRNPLNKPAKRAHVSVVFNVKAVFVIRV